MVEHGISTDNFATSGISRGQDKVEKRLGSC